MGCGGSRTDALEPRYLESWTKETESTWLTSTDADMALSTIHNIPSENSSESGFASDKNAGSVTDFFDDSLPAPAQAYVKVSSSTCGSDTAQEPLVQKRSVVRTEEITKWQDSKMSTKQVTITVTQSIRQVDKSGKIKEKSHTTFEVMKPVSGCKETETKG